MSPAAIAVKGPSALIEYMIPNLGCQTAAGVADRYECMAVAVARRNRDDALAAFIADDRFDGLHRIRDQTQNHLIDPCGYATDLRQRFVEFEFSIGEELVVELVMPYREFRIFCEERKARMLPAEGEAALELMRLAESTESDRLGAGEEDRT